MAQSAIDNGILAYTLPPIPTLFGTITYDSLLLVNEIVMYVDVVNADGETLTCASNASNKCRVKYNWSYTPQWYFINPKVVYPGAHTTLKIKPSNAYRL